MRSRFKLSDPIVVTSPIEISPCNTTIEKGARGKIIDVDPDTADLTIRLSGGYRPDLACRRNIIWLAAHEAAHKVKPCSVQYLTFNRWLRYSIALCVIVTSVAIGVRHYMDENTRNTLTGLLSARVAQVEALQEAVQAEHHQTITPISPTYLDLDAPHNHSL